MQKTVVKYSIIFLLLLVYINRGLFVAPYEIENHGNNETNSVMEWIIQSVTGESNDIDEDGDSQSNCHFVKIVQYDFSEQITKNFDLANLWSKNINNFIPHKEDIPQKSFYTQIDQPPEMI